jgi:hypothetical protein
MTNRTLQFYGQGYGSTPPTITVTIDGNQVFSGPVLGSVDETPPQIFFPADYNQIYIAQLPIMANTTSYSFSLTVSGGLGIYTGLVKTNYNGTGNVASPSSGPTEFQVQPDVNSNVYINGQSVVTPDPKPDGQEGAWTYWIPSGSTMTATMTIQGGVVVA